MKNKREFSYNDLINALIHCTQEEEGELLAAYPRLQDVNLVYQLLQRGTELRKVGQREGAERLENLASSVLQSLTTLPTEGTVNLYLHTKQDADRLFQQGTDFYQNSQFHSALQIWQQALSIYQELGNLQGEVYVLDHLGVVLQSLGEYQKARECLQQSLKIQQESGDWVLNTSRLFHLTHHPQGEFHLVMNLTIEHFQECLRKARSLGDRVGETRALSKLGQADQHLGHFQQALDYYLEAYSLQKKLGDHRGIAFVLQALGQTYQGLGNVSQAIQSYQKHIGLARELNCSEQLEQSLIQLGNLFCASKQYTNALRIHQQSLYFCEQKQDLFGMSIAWSGMGNVFYALEEYSNALDAYEKALVLKREIQDALGEAIVLNNLSRSYEALGNGTKAQDYLRQSIQIQVKNVGFENRES